MPHRVFMLEDDHAVATMVSLALEKEEMELLAWNRLDGAMEAVSRFKPDIALLDVNLPDGDGYGFCAELRRAPVFSRIPVIFLTAKGDAESRIRGFKAGGLDYVTKPFAVQELVLRMRAHLDIKSRQDALRSEVDKLTLLQRVRQDMLDMILHDLRTPLETIKITIELVRRSGAVTDPKFARVLESADVAADAALFMVNDILDLSVGRLQPQSDVVSLPELLGRLEAILGANFKHLGLRLLREVAPDASPVRTDPELLFRVLLNLLLNAAKFSPSGGSVRLSLRRADGRLRAEVEDEGPGVPEDEKERIFQLYYQSRSPAARASAGFGIGLAFCRLACDALGGRIWVEERRPSGSRFVVEIPCRN